MHLLLAAGFMLYFFHVPSKSTPAMAGLASSTQTNVLHKVTQNNSYVGSTS